MRRAGLALAWLVASVCHAQTILDGDSYGISPFQDWRVLEAPHFVIHYPAALQPVARRSLELLEEAHRTLTPYLRWEPGGRANVLLLDNEDAANGMASPMAGFGIILYATPPDTTFSTTFYDDWLKLLIFHEYTHYVNMDTTLDFWVPLRAFGNIMLPNALWPSWMLEGLAVFVETRFTAGGRGRSSFWDSYLRASVEDSTLDTRDFMSLERLTGTNPYFPKGESAYLFGYMLMAKAARARPPGTTADERDVLRHSDDALGIYSERSGGRIPFFVSSNIQNITGKEWEELWDEWVAETKTRSEAQLAKIKSLPLTPVKRLQPNDHDLSFVVQGVQSSPDGKWLATTSSSTEEISGLRIWNTANGDSRRLDNKILGIQTAFTPDSKALLISRLTQQAQYNLRTDLEVFELDTGRNYALTEGLRARDPAISADGKWVAFTQAADATVGLSVARLKFPQETASGRYELAEVRRAYWPERYDRVATPQFRRDGRAIVFAFHANGTTGESLVELDLASAKLRELVSTGPTHTVMNRFPVLHPTSGALYFVSDLSGVDNLYRLGPTGAPTQVTNVTTGLWFPSFGGGAGGTPVTLHAGLLSSAGWDLVRVELPFSEESKLPAVPTAQVTVPGLAPPEGAPMPTPPPRRNLAAGGRGQAATEEDGRIVSSQSVEVFLPEARPVSAEGAAPGDDASGRPAELAKLQEGRYSPWRTLIPRYWLPVARASVGGIYLGGAVYGNDALDQHRYQLNLGLDTKLSTGDIAGLYENRMAGVTGHVSGGYELAGVLGSGGVPSSYYRLVGGEVGFRFPWRHTFSTLQASLSAGAQRLIQYGIGTSTVPIDQSVFVPYGDFTLSFSNRIRSSLAIASEQGRLTTFGARGYFNTADQQWSAKLLLIDREYFNPFGHWVFSPVLKALWTTRPSSSYATSNANLVGRFPALSYSLPSDNITQLSLRGYPYLVASSRAVVSAALNVSFPVARVFSGIGTLPVFFENLSGTAFAEAAAFPFNDVGVFWLPSAGGGLRFDSEFFIRLPIALVAEFHQGLRTDAGGSSDVVIEINVSGLPF